MGEQRHQTFSNIVLKVKLRKAVQFLCDREGRWGGGGWGKPDELADDCKGMINDTVSSFLEGKHLRKTIPSCDMLETYEETPISIPVNVTEKAVESVSHKLSGDSGPGGTD